MTTASIETVSAVRTRPRGFSRAAVASIADPQERIRQILADRSTLGRVRLLAHDQLVKKELRPHCVFCERRFRAFSRKFHCRACGEVVCSSCNRKRDVQVGNGSAKTRPVRLCFDCIDQALSSPTQDASAPASQCVAPTACSSPYKPTHTLLDSFKSTGSGGTFTDSFTRLEFAGDDSDRESSFSDDWDDTSTSHSTGDDPRTRPTSSVSSTSGSKALGFVPEDASFGDFAGEMERAIDALDNERRAALLQQYHIDALPCQRELDAICQLTSRALDCRVAAVGFMGDATQWYKAKIGISPAHLPRDVAFCTHFLHCKTPAIVMDTSKDRRFRQNPLVTGLAQIRFYASAPVCDPVTQLVLGSVFVMDPQPKSQLPARSMEVLTYASKAVEYLLLHSQKTRRAKHQQRQQRQRRARSVPTQAAPSDSEDDIEKHWTSEPKPRASRRRRSSGVALLDSESLLLSLKSLTKRSSRREDERHTACESPMPSRIVATPPAAPPPSPGLCEELLQQIETTQHFLSSLRLRPRTTEVEV